MHVIEIGGSGGEAAGLERWAVTAVATNRAAITAVRMGFIRARVAGPIMPKREWKSSARLTAVRLDCSSPRSR